MRCLLMMLAALAVASAAAHAQESRYYDLPKGDYPHDVAVGPSGEVWYAGQNLGIAGRLNPASGEIERISLGKKSAPHGVIVGPDGAPWFTDGGQNAIVRVDPATKQVKVWPLPAERMPYTGLNTAAFDGQGRIWFTGQNGVYGRLNPMAGDMKVWDAPRGPGPYGITSTPNGDIWFVSLAGSYLANVDLKTGAATVYEPPTKDQGARRVWSDSKGRLWISEWNSGNVSVYDPSDKSWKQWKLPGEKPRTYAVWVDLDDKVWLSEWAANAIVRFHPATEKFESFPSNRKNANVRQMLGRKGETWIAESGTERIRVIRHPVGNLAEGTLAQRRKSETVERKSRCDLLARPMKAALPVHARAGPHCSIGDRAVRQDGEFAVSVVRSSRHELLAAVDVVRRARECCVAHDVNG